MQKRANRFRRAFIALFLLGAFAVGSQAQPSLWAGSGSSMTRLGRVDGTGTLIASNASAAAIVSPRSWELRGDFGTDSALAEWSPSYALVRRSSLSRLKRPELVGVASVSLEDGGEASGLPLRLWPGERAENGLLILSWVCQGRATQTQVFAEGTTLPPVVHFFLKEEEMGGGPALLRWEGGGFVEPSHRFSDTLARAAYFACLRGQAEELANAVRAGLDVRVCDAQGMSLLAHCAEAGATRCIPFLLQQAPDLAALADQGGLRPLDHAARNGREMAVQLLLSAKPDGDSLSSALALASARGHAVCAGLLAAAFPEASPVSLVSICLTAFKAGHPEVVARVLELPVGEALVRDRAILDAWLELLARGDLAGARALSRFPLAVNAEARGLRPVQVVLKTRQSELLRSVLDSGGSATLADASGETPLALALKLGEPALVRSLLALGVPLPPDALHRAVKADSSESLLLLLRAGAHPEMQNAAGQTALEAALLEGRRACVSALLQSGAELPVESPAFEALLEEVLRLDQPQALKSGPVSARLPGVLFAGRWPVAAVAEFLGATRCLSYLGGAEISAAPDFALVEASELDHALVLHRQLAIQDPRPLDAVFTRQQVTVRYLVDVDGAVRFVSLVNCPDERLAQAILGAARALSYDPPRAQGRPAAVPVTLSLQFPSSRERQH